MRKKKRKKERVSFSPLPLREREQRAACFFSRLFFSLSLSFSCFPGLERRRGRDKEEKKRAAGAEKRKKRSKKPEEEAHLGVVDEVRDGRGQEIGLGLEVRVEDRDVVVVGQLLEPLLEGPRLVP